MRTGTSAAAIRDAFASGEFARAHGLWRDYARELSDVVRGGAEAAEEVAEAGELIGWARLFVKCYRAHATARLNEAHAADAYARRSPAARPRVRAIF